jgi:hypothetical protein
MNNAAHAPKDAPPVQRDAQKQSRFLDETHGNF